MERLTRIREQLGLKGNLIPVIGTRSLDATGWQMFEAVWQPYLLSLGASISQIGVISSTYLGFYAGLQFFTGTVSDSLGRKKTMLIAYSFSLASILLIFTADSWILILPVMAVFALVDALAEPSIVPLIAESVPEDKRGQAFSLLSQCWFLPGLFAPALGGLIGATYGFTTILFMVLATETLSLLLFRAYVKETLREVKPLNLHKLAREFVSIVIPEKSLLRLYSTVITNRFAYALFDGVLYTMLIKNYGYTALMIAFAANVFTMTTAVSLFGAGRLVDKVGSRNPILASNLLWVLTLILILASNVWPILFLAMVIRGLSVALWDPALNTLVSSETTELNRGRVTGKMGAMKGILTFPAPIIGALLFDTYGFSGPVALSFTGILVSTGLAWGLRAR